MMKKIVCISLAITVSIILLVVQVYAKDPEMKTQRCPQGEVVIGLDDKGIIICDPLPPSWAPDTMDADGDSFDSPYGGGDDCDDYDNLINPGVAEICTDEIDNNCDGLVDTADPNCLEICDDTIDNDGDTYTDCNDTDCVGDPNCPTACTDYSQCGDIKSWFCSKPVGACDGAGECRWKELCKICEPGEEVCGENGVTYPCKCSADSADVCVVHIGVCAAP